MYPNLWHPAWCLQMPGSHKAHLHRQHPLGRIWNAFLQDFAKWDRSRAVAGRQGLLHYTIESGFYEAFLCPSVKRFSSFLRKEHCKSLSVLIWPFDSGPWSQSFIVPESGNNSMGRNSKFVWRPLCFHCKQFYWKCRLPPVLNSRSFSYPSPCPPTFISRIVFPSQSVLEGVKQMIIYFWSNLFSRLWVLKYLGFKVMG